ncbi:hypothetical protein [Streptomyces longisporoflavus]|uniref:Resolvase/invertase-type recombinase catalytic domain-containing protein n=1 Tax=Streptomyces longisporoflavus TaxID=28044 RepID=A0ABW7R3W9_9ACTN
MTKIPAPAPAVPLTTPAAAAPAAPVLPRGVLYTCNTNPAAVARVLADLRGFAAVHGWPVFHEVYDLAPPGTPRRRRFGWRTVEQLVLRGEVNAVIAPSERELACTRSQLFALRRWLSGAGACALYPHDGPPQPACTPVQPEGVQP